MIAGVLDMSTLVPEADRECLVSSSTQRALPARTNVLKMESSHFQHQIFSDLIRPDPRKGRMARQVISESSDSYSIRSCVASLIGQIS